jgi:hypothetical protein
MEFVDDVHGKLVTFGLKRPKGNLVGTFFDGKELKLQTEDGVVSIMSRDEILLRGEHIC